MPIFDTLTIYAVTSYIFLVLAFVMTNILLLRFISIVSAVLAILYYWNYQQEPIWISIVSECGFIGVNIVQIILLYLEQNIKFSDNEKSTYESLFPFLTKKEARKFFDTGQFVTFPKGKEVIHQGEVLDQLMVIVEGAVEIIIDNHIVGYCKKGNFLGEMSYISGKPPLASVRTLNDLRVLVFVKEKLSSMLAKDPDIAQKMQIYLSKDLIEKLVNPKTEEDI